MNKYFFRLAELGHWYDDESKARITIKRIVFSEEILPIDFSSSAFNEYIAKLTKSPTKKPTLEPTLEPTLQPIFQTTKYTRSYLRKSLLYKYT